MGLFETNPDQDVAGRRLRVGDRVRILIPDRNVYRGTIRELTGGKALVYIKSLPCNTWAETKYLKKAIVAGEE